MDYKPLDEINANDFSLDVFTSNEPLVIRGIVNDWPIVKKSSEDIQKIADHIGDSYALAKISKELNTKMIVFCGVHFMAETAKILNPTAKVLIPDLHAGCSLADATPLDAFVAFKKQHPDAVVVSYINCTAAVKSMSDYICTSSNAVDVVKAIPLDHSVRKNLE